MNGYLREAQENDVDLLYQWVNEESVRRNSFYQGNITYNEHLRWFHDFLVSFNKKQYIYIYDEEPIGQICVVIDGDVAEVTYSIALEKRCMGHAQRMLSLLEKRIQQDFPEVKRLTARVKPSNMASQIVFQNLQYETKCEVFELVLGKTKQEQDCSVISGGIIFLTNNNNALSLYKWLAKKVQVELISERLYLQQLNLLKPRLIISYNYKYLISEEVINFMQGKIINLHISYLPWNRGASPNIWSFIDDTPKGVTIHQISPELDKGKILYQKECFFCPEKETFETVYKQLHKEIVELFKAHWEEICDGKYTLYEQEGTGSYHALKDLIKLKEHIAFEWTDNIALFLEKYKKYAKKVFKEK